MNPAGRSSMIVASNSGAPSNSGGPTGAASTSQSRPASAQHRGGGTRRGAGGHPVIDDHHGGAGDVERRPVAAERPHRVGQLGSTTLDRPRARWRSLMSSRRTSSSFHTTVPSSPRRPSPARVPGRRRACGRARCRAAPRARRPPRRPPAHPRVAGRRRRSGRRSPPPRRPRAAQPLPAADRSLARTASLSQGRSPASIVRATRRERRLPPRPSRPACVGATSGCSDSPRSQRRASGPGDDEHDERHAQPDEERPAVADEAEHGGAGDGEHDERDPRAVAGARRAGLRARPRSRLTAIEPIPLTSIRTAFARRA